MDRSTRRAIEERVVEITEVNMSTQTVICVDQYNTFIYASFHFLDPVVSIPAVKERWTIKRRGNDWFLDKRQDTGLEASSLQSLAPGDTRLEATNDLFLNATRIFLNGIQHVTSAFAIKKNGAVIGTRAGINFHDGTNTTVTVVDDPTNNEIDVTVDAAASSNPRPFAFFIS